MRTPSSSAPSPTTCRHAGGAALIWLASLAAACGGADAGPAPLPPRTVASAFTTTWWPSSGTTTTARVSPPAGTTVSALVPDPALGYRTFPGALAADGAFTIPDVPGGHYLLRVDQPWRASYLDGSFTFQVMDFTRTVLTEFTTSAPPQERLRATRPDLVMPTTETATFNFSNLDAFASRDMLWLCGQDLGADVLLLRQPAPVDPTALSVPDVAWNTVGGLPDFTKGDALYAIQRKVATADGVTTRLTTRYARLQSLDFTSGPAVVDVPMVAAPLSQGLPVDLRKTRFAALLPSVAPALTPGLSLVTVGAYATQHANGYPAPTGMAMRYLFLQSDASSADQDLGTIAYGGFGEPGWKEFRVTGLVFEAELTLPGSASSVLASGTVTASEPLPGAAAPIAPILGPVTSPRVNGQDAFTPRTGVGVQPTITWSAPALGSPTAYLVRVVPALSYFDSEVLLATVFGATSLRVPPGILTAGTPYFAVITAARGPQYALDRSPDLRGFPAHTADVITAVFIP